MLSVPFARLFNQMVAIIVGNDRHYTVVRGSREMKLNRASEGQNPPPRRDTGEVLKSISLRDREFSVTGQVAEQARSLQITRCSSQKRLTQAGTHRLMRPDGWKIPTSPL